MPHIETLEPKHHAFNILFGQRPLTVFRDYYEAIKVELIKHDDPASMLKGTFDFVRATWSLDGRESERATSDEMNEALQQMLSGKALGLGLETVNFMFRISGITRIDTHQIVRQRIGVTFSQQCSGDQFWHHMDCLVEPSIYWANHADRAPYRHWRKATLQNKASYAEMTDTQRISIQAARSILPHNLETFIFMNTNLATLLFFFQKRIDDGSQTWQINEVARQMANQCTNAFWPLAAVFEKHAKAFRFQREASADRKNTFSTSLYIPRDDEFEYNERDFLYPMKKNEMHLVGPHHRQVPMEYYWGFARITEPEYLHIAESYERVNRAVRAGHFSNKEILEMGLDTTFRLEREIQG